MKTDRTRWERRRTRDRNQPFWSQDPATTSVSPQSRRGRLPRRCGAALWALLIVCGAPGAGAAQEGIGPGLRQDFDENVAGLSPLTVKWRRTRTSPLPVSRVLEIVGLPKTSVELLAPESVRLKWRSGRFHAYIWRNMPPVDERLQIIPTGPLEQQEQELSCDGRSFYSGNPNRRGRDQLADPVLLIDPLERLARDKPQQHLLTAEYLYLAGFRMPATAGQLLADPPRTLVMDLLQTEGQLVQVTLETIDGVAMPALEIRHGDERTVLALDPRRNHMLRRRHAFAAAGGLKAQIDCLDPEPLPDTDVWLPRRIESAMYYPQHSAAEPLIQEIVSVEELHNQPLPDEDFVLKYTSPGTHVFDGTLPGAERAPRGRIGYVTPADAQQLDEVIREAVGGPQPKSGFRMLRWVIVGNVVLALAAFAAMLHRRRRRK